MVPSRAMRLLPTLVVCVAIWSGCARPTAAPGPVRAPAVAAVPAVPAQSRPCEQWETCRFRVAPVARYDLHAAAEGRDVLAAQVEASEWAVVADPTSKASRVQMVCSRGKYWVSVYLDRGALRPLTTEYVLATPTPRRAASPVGVSLAPGTVVTVGASEGDDVHVEFEVESIKGSGWIPRSVLGDVYDIEMPDPRGLPDHGRVWMDWEVPVAVLAEPRGPAIASVQGPVEIQRIGAPRDGHVLAAINFVLEQRTYAVGWIPVAALTSGSPHVRGGVIVERPDDDLPEVPVPAGAELRSAGGSVVGSMRMHAKLPCLADCAGPSPVVQISCMGDFPATVVRP